MASESGAGISISPNGVIPLEHLDLMDDLKSNSYKSQKGILKYKSELLLEMPSPVYSMNRRDLMHILYKRYKDLGGEVLFDHELTSIEGASKELVFSNSNSYKINHIVACDGIKSFIRENFFRRAYLRHIVGIVHGEDLQNQIIVMLKFISDQIDIWLVILLMKILKRSFTGIVKTKNQRS